MNVFGSVVLRASINEKYNAVTFREFLTSMSPVSGEVYMAPDSVKYHHANLLKDFPGSNSRIILGFFLHIILS